MNGIWQSSLDMSVLTFHTSWYYCKATDNNETVQYGSIQLFVEDSSKIDYVNTRVYAFVVNWQTDEWMDGCVYGWMDGQKDQYEDR